jgi:hypothetical protein
MSQNFISCDREPVLLLPPSLMDWLPEDHLVWSVLGAVDHMNLDRSTARVAPTAKAARRMTRT